MAADGSQGGASRPVLVTGAAGMLGSQLLLDAPTWAHAVGTDLVPASAPGAPAVERVGADLTDEELVRSLLAERPWYGVIHAAAYTAVDKAEEETELAWRINALAPELLARACAAHGIPLVLVSTDFVFDGTREEPYPESHPPSPLGVYGRTKLEGEERACAEHPDGVRVVRTQWLYGPRGNHFPGTMLRLAESNERLRVVDDQRGSPTTTLELAPALWDVLEKGAAGVYHAACEGEASWYDLACATLELAGDATPVDPCTTDEFPRPAPRPAYSVLACDALTALRGRPLADWREALATFLRAEGLQAS